MNIADLKLVVKVDSKELDGLEGKIKNTASKSENVFTKMDNKVKGAFDNVKTHITGALDKAGEKFPHLTKIAEGSFNGIKKGADIAISGVKAIGSVGATALKGLGVAVGAVSAGVVALGKAALDQYSSFEQLEGGINKLYGQGGQNLYQYAASVGKTVEEAREEYLNMGKAEELVMKNAGEAYKTMGMNVNEYLDTASSFASTLKQSLGGDTLKAAEQTQKAMEQMADNASVFGTDIESVRNAYQGFAKDNYMMLDNLKLGYGGTKEEMQRLLEDAEEISGIHFDMSSYSDIIDAIGVIQDEMGLTGNAANEAAHTMEGSINATKAAYDNFLTGLMDSDADIGKLTTDLIDSAMNVVTNIMPLVENMATSISTALPGVIGQIMDNVATLLPTFLPTLLQSVLQIITGLGQAIMSNLDIILNTLGNVIGQMASFLVENIGPMVESVVTIITKLIGKITDNLPQILKTIGKIMLEVAKALAKALPDLVKAVVDLIVGLCNTIWNNRGLILQKIKEVVAACKEAIVQSLSNIWEGVKSIFGGGGGGNPPKKQRTGIAYVPYDGYYAELHRGERVLNSSENMQYTNKTDDRPIVNNTYNITVPSNENALETAIKLRDMTMKEQYGY